MRRFIRLAVFTCAAAAAVQAETYTLTLKQAIERGMARNPDVTLAKLDQIRATQGIRVEQSPFYPRVGVGSGLAYTNGMPLSIEGSAPAIVEARANEYLFNEPQRYAVKAQREAAKSAGFAAAAKGDDVAWQIAGLFLDVDRASRMLTTARNQIDSFQKVLDTVQARVEEGRELPIDVRQARYNLAAAKVRLSGLESDRDLASHNLAIALGYGAGDTVQATTAERTIGALPMSEAAAVQSALAGSAEIRRLESALVAKGLEVKSQQARKLPQIDLVAQYALFSKYNGIDQYFTRFQRNNGEIGASFQLPLFAGAGIRAAVAQLDTDREHLKVEMQSARDKIALGIHQSYVALDRAKLGGDLAKEGLDLAREQLTLALNQLGEGHATLRDVEQARINESEKWIAFYDAQFAEERARLDVLRQAGNLLASLQ